MAVTTLIILAIWTAVSPIEWVREEVDDTTGESFGRCRGDNVAAWFAAPIFVIMISPIALTFIMAWKTKDVDEAFSETWWIFALIFVQLQVRHPCIFWCKRRLSIHPHCDFLFRRLLSLLLFSSSSTTFPPTDATWDSH
jgi:hypothetical protein